MKQFQIIYDEPYSFRNSVRKICGLFPNCKTTATIFYDNEKRNKVEELVEILETECPEAEYFGCSSNANIEEGKLVEGTVQVTLNIFEDSDTKIKVLGYPINENNQEEVCNNLLEEVKKNSWVKGIEILITLMNMSITYFCDRLSEMNENIQIFGGSAFSKNFDRFDVSAFTKKEGFMDSGVVFVLMGGENLNIYSTFISGWKPLGHNLLITKSEGNRIYEINNNPAYDTYFHYLKIENDKYFYENALEFPISYDRNGINILRVPSACLEDGSLIMTSEVQKGAVCQLYYGDPQTVLRSIFHEAERIADFVPDGILIFDCASRRTFWGDEDINRESMPFNTIADTAGFYTAGEFHRYGSSLNQHNVTLVIVGIREGKAGKSNKSELLKKYNYNSEKVSIVRRLANFIDAAACELEEANKKLESANVTLTKMATTDELTSVFNRREIQNRITAESERTDDSVFSLIMLDLDNFKKVNDTYGHDEGDRVLKVFSRVMRDISESYKMNISIGRWGGEEFMILVPESDSEKACEVAENIRKSFKEIDFEQSGKHTVSCGVTMMKSGETADEVCSRVDEALYNSKKSGRNKTSVI